MYKANNPIDQERSPTLFYCLDLMKNLTIFI
jgi:hypothetical protein